MIPNPDAGYATDVDLTAGPTADQLALVVQLAQLQQSLDAQISAAIIAIEALQAQRKDVAEKQLPDALTEAGLQSFKLADGSTVGIDEKVFGNVTKEHEAAFHEWLIENGHGDLIKRALTADFGRGQEELLEKLRAFVDENLGADVKVTEKAGVHYQTLGAFVREQISLGTDLPETLDVITIRQAVIKAQKKKVRL
jgi:hypothetical protein